MEAISIDNKQMPKPAEHKEHATKPAQNSYSSHNKIAKSNSTQNKLNTPKQPPPIPPKNIHSKYTDTAKTNTVVDNFKPTTNNSVKLTNGNDKKIAPVKPVEKIEPPKKMDHIKRPKKNKGQKMSEADARKILETMVTPGDPHDKYTLKNKLGSG